jgi:hypothetical protein
MKKMIGKPMNPQGMGAPAGQGLGQIQGRPVAKPMPRTMDPRMTPSPQGGSVRDTLLQAMQSGAVKPRPRTMDPRAMGAMVGNKLSGAAMGGVGAALGSKIKGR